MIETSNLTQTVVFLLINLGYAVVALIVSLLALLIIDKMLFRQIDFVDEIKQGNLAASIFYSVILLFIGLVVATSLS